MENEKLHFDLLHVKLKLYDFAVAKKMIYIPIPSSGQFFCGVESVSTIGPHNLLYLNSIKQGLMQVFLTVDLINL